jgi:GDP-4-dehydro-6-deoxy-D-mannose reductase
VGKVWISGAGGMIGSHLTGVLVQQGHEVVGTYHNPTVDLDEIGHFRLEHVDVTDWSSVYDSIDRFQPDVVFHLAAQSYPTESWNRPASTMTANVIGTVNLFEVLRRMPTKARIVVACSSAEYGTVNAFELPVTEDAPLRPLHPYGVSKVAQDLLAYQYHQNYGMETVRARLFNCTGTRKVGDAVSDFVRRVVWLENHPQESVLRVGNLETRRTIVDVRDVIQALIALAERGRAGEVYNVGGNQAHLLSDVVACVLESSTRRDIEVKTDPALLRPADEPVIWGDTSRIKRDTGWQPAVPLRETIAAMLTYWRSRSATSDTALAGARQA